MNNRFAPTIMAAVLLFGAAAGKAQQALPDTVGMSDGTPPPVHSREYTADHPLIYEGSWDLWPYTFLNVNGQPDGYSVDLVRLILDRLNIPYVIKLKAQPDVFNDLREGRSDLMLGIAAGFHDQYGHYGNTAITLFTQSVATPKDRPVPIHTFSDLANHHVIVNAGSLAYHLMVNQGWAENATVTTDIKESMMKVSTQQEGIILWNDLGLKWLVKRFQLDNIQLTPVNMPHGEYKFMSNDTVLLARMDSIYSELYSAEAITPLQNKWFYPERSEKPMPSWVWYLLAAGALLLVVLLLYYASYRLQQRRITSNNAKLNRRLALILETSAVHILTFSVDKRLFTWHNENGQPAYTYSPEEFSKRYTPDDYRLLRNTILRLAATPPPEDKEEEVRLHIKAKDVEEGSCELRDYTIAVSVLSRDADGKPAVIIGTKKDITDSTRQQRQYAERALRYWAIFRTPLVGIIFFDKHGLMQDINAKACQIYQCDRDEILATHCSVYDMLDIDGIDISDIDGMHATQYVNIDAIPEAERLVPPVKRRGLLCNEFHLMMARDEDGKPFGIFVICQDVTNIVSNSHEKRQAQADLLQLERQLADCYRKMDGVLHEHNFLPVSYSPSTRMLTIFRSANEVQHVLPQLRCMTLVDNPSRHLAMRLLTDMDHAVQKDIMANIATTLRRADGKPLRMQFSLTPRYDKRGRVVEYFGLCRDISSCWRAAKTLLLFFVLLIGSLPAMSQSWKQRYTKERPLVIVGDWDKPPYEFLNRDGKPSGTNVEAMELVFREMDIPYRYVLKEWGIALKMFERGDADVILANSNRYRGGRYAISENIINYNRICAASLGSSPRSVGIAELLQKGVVLKPNDFTLSFFRNIDSTYSQHLDFQSPKVALTGLKDSIYQFFIWGEEPLKWKLREFNIEGIVLNEVPIPVSDIYMIGHDHALIEAMDDHYSRLKQSGKIQAIVDHWLHPEHEQRHHLSPLPFLIGGALLLLAALAWLFNIMAKRQMRAVHHKSSELNDMMIRALHMGNFDITEYDIKHDRMTNLYGRLLPSDGITLEEFISHIHPHEQQEFRRKMERLLNGRDRQFELNKRWRTFTPDGSWLYFQGHAMVELDANGQPAYVINAVHDVTRDEHEVRTNQEIASKYQQLSNLPFFAISFYDADGQLIGLNESMQWLCGITDDAPEASHFWENTNLFDIPMFRSAYARGSTYPMQACMHMLYPDIGIDRYVSYEMRPLFNANGELVHYFCSTLDMTDTRNHYLSMRQLHLQQADIRQHISMVQNWLHFARQKGDCPSATPGNT